MGFWSSSKTEAKEKAVRPGREGEQLRVQQLELQLQELATTAAQAVDRAEGLETELKQIRTERDELQRQRPRHYASPSNDSTSTMDNSLYSAPTRSSSFTTIGSREGRQNEFDITELQQRIRELQTSNETLMDKLQSETQRQTDLQKQVDELTQTNQDTRNKLRNKNTELREQTTKLQEETKVREGLQSRVVELQTEMKTSQQQSAKQLEDEVERREVAEKREHALSNQIEDLSQSLFEEANKKVKLARQKCQYYEDKLKRMDPKELDRDTRWYNIEVAISAIHKARNAINSAHLNTYR